MASANKSGTKSAGIISSLTALDELLVHRATIATAMDEYVRQRETIATFIVEHARQTEATIELAARICPSAEQIAAMTVMAEPPRFDYYVSERVHPVMAWTPAFDNQPDFEAKPNQRTIVRPEVKRRIGFRR